MYVELVYIHIRQRPGHDADSRARRVDVNSLQQKRNEKTSLVCVDMSIVYIYLYANGQGRTRIPELEALTLIPCNENRNMRDIQK